MAAILHLWLVGIGLVLVQLLAAVPWAWLVLRDLVPLGRADRQLVGRGAAGLAGAVLAGGLLAALLALVSEPERLQFLGRLYGSVLHLQVAIDLFALFFTGFLWAWPKGAAVALAAFREGIRQPMFWLLAAAASVLLLVSLFIPYFSFLPGDELKMMKQLGFDIVMLASAAFGVLAAAMSISEEIEGRTAVTLMSKPVSRRQFLLGKFAGILLAAVALAVLTGWLLDWTLYFKPVLDAEPVTDPLQLELDAAVTGSVQRWSLPAAGSSFVEGAARWLADALAALPYWLIALCQVMVLVAIATALATRLPMMLNLGICLVIFFLGHLAPVLVQWSQAQQQLYRAEHGHNSVAWELAHFVARLCDTLLPALEYSNLAPAIIRDSPLDPADFAAYVGTVLVYALVYTAIALLFGLILFEDRDLA
jgi:hypothetical protein